jgi:hypothetical protein
MSFLYDITASSKGFEVLEEQISLSSSWKALKIRGTFQRADAKNHNGRVYPFNVLNKAVEEVRESLNSRNMFGELDHPADQSPTVSLRNVSHVITNLKFMGSDLIGEAIVFDDPGPAGTPQGRILGSLIRNNCTVGISSRGLGAVKPAGIMSSPETIVEQYKLITFDCVHDPSTQNAYVEAVNESRKYSIQQALEEQEYLNSFRSSIQQLLRNKK